MSSLAITGAQSSTIDLINALISTSYKINYVINPDPSIQHMISDYQDLERLINDINAKLLRRKTYIMINIDILIVFGWQRLVTAWLVNKIGIGVFGMHESSEPSLPKSR